ncbi:MAG: aldehyde dehydrogenase family protein, partial [Rhizobium sp.]|nr:aldehyde dehydrogenase family protein [Rhizobium sp.]
MTLANLNFSAEVAAIMGRLGVPAESLAGGTLSVRSPINGEKIAAVTEINAAGTKAAIDASHQAFLEWRLVPAPKRGELIRLLGEELRAAKADLGRLVSIEVGKIVSEGLGEVQEMIDICDFAVGLSRQLYGLTIATERAEHRMMESWHPLGITGIISAFNFPVAVWAWNSALALVCGNSTIWKPSEKTPLTAIATQAIFEKAVSRYVADGGKAPANLSTLLIGGREIGEILVDSPKVPLISATGSTAMGRAVGPRVAIRFGRSILELGGNNAAIVCPTADLDLTLRGVAFAAMGTAGQRCTSLRRLFVHESVYDKLVPRLIQAYGSVSVGNPLQSSTLVGPLIDEGSFGRMQKALDEAKAAGGKVSGGDRLMQNEAADAYYVRPAIVEMPAQTGPVKDETFAPILYIIKYSDFDEALALNNDV